MAVEREDQYFSPVKVSPEQKEAMMRHARLLGISISALARLILLWARDGGEYTPYRPSRADARDTRERGIVITLTVTPLLNSYLTAVSRENEETKGNLLFNAFEAWKAWHPYYDEEEK